MSEKELSKSAWETQVKKHSLEDKALAKALAAYEKCDDKDPEAKAEALKAVTKAAETLKKDKEYKEVAGYLGDVLSACDRAGKALAKLEEEAEEEEGDEESAEYAKDLGKQMKLALGQVKARAPGEPPAPGAPSLSEEELAKQLKFTAYVAGGACAVIVGKKSGGGMRKLVASIAGVSGGKYFQGDCIFEKSAYTFVMDQPASGMARKLSGALLEETGQKYKVRVRSLDGLTELDDETDTASEPESQTQTQKPQPPSPLAIQLGTQLKALNVNLQKAIAGTAPSAGAAQTEFLALVTLLKEHRAEEAAPRVEALAALIQKALGELAPTGDAGAAAFKERLTALMPGIKEAIAAGTPAGQEIRLKVSEAGALAKQNNFAGASALLDEVEDLLGGKPEANEEALFKQRLTALMPKIKEAIAAGTPEGQAIRLKATEAGALAKQNDYAQANGILSEVEIMLGAPTPSTGPGGAKPFSLVTLQKSRLAWDSLRKTIQTQLQDLEQEILATVRAHNADETSTDEFDEGDVAGRVKSLYGMLEKLDERLIDKLDEALNAQTDEARQARHAEAGGIIQEYKTFAASDPMLATIDENGFTKSSIRSSVEKTLGELAANF